MVFNATLNKISVILWQSVVLVEETRVPIETTDLWHVTDKLYHIMWKQHKFFSKSLRKRSNC